MGIDTTTSSPDELRVRMVDKVRASGHAYRGGVEEALRETPRHEFVPDAELTAAYDPWQAVVTHRFDDGRSLSCASAPWLVAAMLDQLDVEPGCRVLEIGAGTGYNACLLARLAGRGDLVTTVDRDPDVAAQARRALGATGYGDVHVITGDGGRGFPDHAPYDRVIATVSPWDIPAAWWNQLAPGARLVAPLRWRGQGRSVAFTFTDGRLVSDSIHLCGFVYLVGEAEGELSGSIVGDGLVTLHWDRDQAVDVAALRGVLDEPRVTAWSGIVLGGNESHDELWLRLTVSDQRVCRIKVDADVPREVCDPVPGWWRMALVDGSTLAYLTARLLDDTGRHELGVIGHGPVARDLSEYVCEQIGRWARTREQLRPTLTVYRAGTPDSDLAGGAVFEKDDSRFVVSFEPEA